MNIKRKTLLHPPPAKSIHVSSLVFDASQGDSSSQERALLCGNKLDCAAFSTALVLNHLVDVLLAVTAVTWEVLDDTAIEGDHGLIMGQVGDSFFPCL